MRDPEYYAKPGVYLDTDDHGQLVESNREAYLHERRKKLIEELERIDHELEGGQI